MPSSFNAGSVVVRILGDAVSLNKAVRGAVGGLYKMGDVATSVGTKMAVSLSLPVVGGIATAITSYGAFEKKLIESVSIMTGVTDSIQADMAKVAQDLSTKGVQSATDLAESYYFLASAGLSAQQSMQALPVVQKFATAGAFDMALATDLLTDAQTALGYSSLDAQKNMEGMLKVSDAIALGAKQANSSVQGFSESLTNDAAVASRQFGMELETTMAVLGAYASQGKKGAEAGNLLGRATRLLGGAYGENKKVFQKYNIEVEDAQGNYRNLIDIVADMEKSFAGLSETTKAARLEELGFAALAQKSILPLIGMSDAMRTWEDQQRSAAGTTEQIAAKQMTSMVSQFKILKNMINVTAIELGGFLAPKVTEIIKKAQSWLTWWKGLSEETKKFNLRLAGFAAALGPGLLGLGIGLKIASRLALVLLGPLDKGLFLAAKAIKFLSLGFKAVRIAALAAMGSWLGPIAIAAAAIGGVILLLKGRKGLAGAWSKATEFAKTAFENVKGFLYNLQHNLKVLGDWIPTVFKHIWDHAGEGFRILFSSIPKMFLEGAKLLRTVAVAAFGLIGRLLYEGVKAGIDGVVNNWDWATKEMPGKLGSSLGKMQMMWGKYAAAVGKVMKAIASGNFMSLLKSSKILQQDASNYAKGASGIEGFKDVVSKAYQEALKKIGNPLEGFKLDEIKGPNLKFDVPDLKTPELENLTQAVKENTEVRQEENEQKKQEAREAPTRHGFSALEAHSAEAYRAAIMGQRGSTDVAEKQLEEQKETNRLLRKRESWREKQIKAGQDVWVDSDKLSSVVA